MDTRAESSQGHWNWFAIWRAVFLRPTVGTFSRITNDPKVTVRWGIFWTAISAEIAWQVGPQKTLLWGLVADTFGLQAGSNFLLVGALAVPAVAAAVLLTTAAISHGLARLFGGTGTLHQLFSCWSVMLPPFVLASGLAMFLPSIISPFTSTASSPARLAILVISLVLYAGVWIYLAYADIVALGAVENIGFAKSATVFILQSFVYAVALTCLSAGFQALITNDLMRR